MEVGIELKDLGIVWLLEVVTIESVVKSFDELFSTFNVFQDIFGTGAL